MKQNEFETGDFLSVLLSLERHIMKNLKVGSLGVIQTIDITNKKVLVELFPRSKNEDIKYINCFCLTNNISNLAKGQIVCVLFLDKNFIKNLKQLQTGVQSNLEVDDTILHNESYGIILNTY